MGGADSDYDDFCAGGCGRITRRGRACARCLEDRERKIKQDEPPDYVPCVSMDGATTLQNFCQLTTRETQRILSNEQLRNIGVPIVEQEVLASDVLASLQPIPAGLPSGWDDLDAALNGGFRPGLYVLTGGTSVGKSALAIAIARSVGSPSRHQPTTIIAAELGKNETVARLVAPLAITPWLNVLESAGTKGFAASTGHLLDGYTISLLDIDPSQDADVQLAALKPCRLLVVDYLQYWARLETGEPSRTGVAQMSHKLSAWAVRNNTTVLAISDVARHFYDTDERKTSAALVAAPKDAGEVEYDAAGMLHLDAEVGDPFVRVRIIKHKFGPRDGRVGFKFDPELNTFTPDSLISEDLLFGKVLKAVRDGYTTNAAIREILQVKKERVAVVIDQLLKQGQLKRVRKQLAVAD
jgi:replicative DNA helicase